MFSTTRRALEADGFRGTTLGVLLVVGLLGAWGAWFLGAQVTLYAVSETARLEMSQAAHPVEAPVAGRVVATHLALGQEVQGGDVLVELDATAQHLQREEEQAVCTRSPRSSRRSTRPSPPKNRRCARPGRPPGSPSTRRGRGTARRRWRRGPPMRKPKLFTRLQARGLPAQLDLLRAKAEAQKRRAAVDTLRLAVSRLESDHRTQESDRNARLEGLRRDVTRLAGDMTTAAATVERLAHEIERRRIRAPMAGRLGEVAELRVGSVVREGTGSQRSCRAGTCRSSPTSCRRRRSDASEPGSQRACGSRASPGRSTGAWRRRCSRVASEVRNGRVRVELSVDPRSRLADSAPARLTGSRRGPGRTRGAGDPGAARRGQAPGAPGGGGPGRAEAGRVSTAPSARRRLLVPEVVQTSAMDCGPAALNCLLEGFGIAVSYGRLREACQTDVDGTSIDTLEEVAVQLGLEAEQMMLPVDHVLLPEAQALPAIVVVRLPSGVTHFVVAWRRHGRVVQLMDPATGRRWPTCQRFLHELYVHTMPFPAAAWREWAGSEECLGALRRRLAQVGLSGRTMTGLVEAALLDPDWRSAGGPRCLHPDGRRHRARRRSPARSAGGAGARALASHGPGRSPRARARRSRPTTGWSGRPRPDLLTRPRSCSGGPCWCGCTAAARQRLRWPAGSRRASGDQLPCRRSWPPPWRSRRAGRGVTCSDCCGLMASWPQRPW